MRLTLKENALSLAYLPLVIRKLLRMRRSLFLTSSLSLPATIGPTLVTCLPLRVSRQPIRRGARNLPILRTRSWPDAQSRRGPLRRRRHRMRPSRSATLDWRTGRLAGSRRTQRRRPAPFLSIKYFQHYASIMLGEIKVIMGLIRRLCR